MAQALLETGYFNDKIPSSYYVRSNFTNWFGMGYNRRGFADGYFTTRTGEKWAKYPNSSDGIRDRFAWDIKPKSKYNPSKSTNIDEYISFVARNGYWVENGRDKGYTKLLYDKLDKYGKTFDALLLAPLVTVATAYLLLK